MQLITQIMNSSPYRVKVWQGDHCDICKWRVQRTNALLLCHKPCHWPIDLHSAYASLS